MSTRWMAVQYVGNVLRMPVVNEGDMDKPFGSSVLERNVNRIVVNPFSDSPQVFVPESECEKLRKERNHWHVEQVHAFGNWEDAHRRVIELEAENAKLRTQLADVTVSMGRVEERCAKLRKLCSALYEFAYDEYPDGAELNFADRMRELGVEVE